MKHIGDRMDTFEIEELVYDAKMRYGNMDEMAKYMGKLGDELVMKEMLLQSLTYALQDSIPASKMKRIVNLADRYMLEYLNRFTTDEMKERLEKEGVGDLGAVLVDADFANEAIENGRDVFAIRNGQRVLLDKHGQGSVYEQEGYILAVTSHTYEAEFENDRDNWMNEE